MIKVTPCRDYSTCVLVKLYRDSNLNLFIVIGEDSMNIELLRILEAERDGQRAGVASESEGSKLAYITMTRYPPSDAPGANSAIFRRNFSRAETFQMTMSPYDPDSSLHRTCCPTYWRTFDLYLVLSRAR